MKKFLNRERIIGLVCMALSAALYIATVNLPKARMDPVGPTVFPKVIAIAGFILSLIYVVISSGPYEPLNITTNYKELLFLVAAVSVYLLLMPRIGFFFSTIPFLFVFTSHYDKREWKEKWLPVTVFSLVFTVLLYLIFAVALKVLLPTIWL